METTLPLLTLPFIICGVVLMAFAMMMMALPFLLETLWNVVVSPIARYDRRWNRHTSLEWALSRLRALDDPQIHGAPGWRLYRIANWVYSRRTFDEVFIPVLSDMQVEYFEALANGRHRKATWVRFRGYWRFATHVVAQAPVSLVRVLSRLWLSAP